MANAAAVEQAQRERAATDVAYILRVVLPTLDQAHSMRPDQRRGFGDFGPLFPPADGYADAVSARGIALEALRDGSDPALRDARLDVLDLLESARRNAQGFEKAESKTILQAIGTSSAGAAVITAGAFTAGATGINAGAVERAIAETGDRTGAAAFEGGRKAAEFLKAHWKLLLGGAAAVAALFGGAWVVRSFK